MANCFTDRFFFVQKTKQQEDVFNNIFKEINSQIAIFNEINQNEGDSYDLIVINLCELLNYNSDELFKKDFNFAMKILTSKAQSDTKIYIKSKLKQNLSRK